MKKCFFVFATLIFSMPILLAKDSSVEWQPFIPEATNACKGKGNEKGFTVRADFDGSGKKDIAKLQKNKKSSRVRVVVWMNGAKNPLVLADDEESRSGDFLALSKPGEMNAFDGVSEYKYKILLPSISYGSCESSTQIFQWDKKSKKFVSSWVSD